MRAYEDTGAASRMCAVGADAGADDDDDVLEAVMAWHRCTVLHPQDTIILLAVVQCMHAAPV